MTYELNLYSYTGIINSLGFALVGIWVLLNNPRALLNKTFALFNLFAFLWSFSYIFWSSATDQATALFWLRALCAPSVFAIPAFLHFTTIFLGVYKNYRKKIFFIYTLFVPFFLMFLFTNLLVKDAVKNYWVFYTPIRGSLLTPYLLFWGGTFAFGGYLIFRHYRSAQGNDRKRLLYALIAFLIAVVGGSTNYIMWYIKVPPIGNPFVFLYGVVMTFIITRYRLFDMKVITTEVLSFAMWYFFLLRFTLAKTLYDMFIEGFFFLGSIMFGYFLIRSARKEAEQKEQLAELNEKLNTANFQLQDLNDHLEQKVAAQTHEIKQAYEVEKKARVELEELDKAKDQFILTTQHHLRTPLTIIKGYIESLLGKPPQNTLGESREALTKTSAAIERLGGLINEFLDVSEMQVSKGFLDKRSTNIKNIIEEVVDELKPEIDKKQIKTTISVPEEPVMNIDPVKMREALTNIVGNAVKYNKENGSITITGEIFLHPIERTRRLFRLTIEDTGIGIQRDLLSKLFAGYFVRGEEAEKIYTTGRGIGLAVTKNIIQAHGGRIYAESEGLDKGTKITIELDTA